MYVGWGLQAPLTDYWTDFESEKGFEKVLPLATILVHPQIVGLQAPLTDCWADFESENGLEKVLPKIKN
jgi:hypothetical protein